ncbi:hypothetical protein NDN01_21570 [Sphingomonas sp. QA11]|uniref:hypothetical protein n=1 Tax=Sphingomonas sp. QA11 TaxID=2950605 RepID=UPI002349DE0A|nr:hypothetical protein [Sphingomonas sp. QA11]WCM26560.1 hypothetical protein NDN01_21570 [Sphingomonas sp. QA11]
MTKQSFRVWLACLTATMAMLVPGQLAQADPYSTPVKIKGVRVYSNPPSNDVVLLTTATAGVCSTTSFSFLLNTPAGQGMLATALTAISSNSNVTIEVSTATGCTTQNGFGAAVQSLTLLSPSNPGPW